MDVNCSRANGSTCLMCYDTVINHLRRDTVHLGENKFCRCRIRGLTCSLQPLGVVLPKIHFASEGNSIVTC